MSKQLKPRLKPSMLANLLPAFLSSFSLTFGPFNTVTVLLSNSSSGDDVVAATGARLPLSKPEFFVGFSRDFGGLGAADLVLCLANCDVIEEASPWTWLVPSGTRMNHWKLRMDSNIYIFEEDETKENVIEVSEVYGLKAGERVFTPRLAKWTSEKKGNGYFSPVQQVQLSATCDKGIGFFLQNLHQR